MMRKTRMKKILRMKMMKISLKCKENLNLRCRDKHKLKENLNLKVSHRLKVKENLNLKVSHRLKVKLRRKLN